MNEKKFNVELSENQLLAIVEATDFQSRIMAGQLDDILHKGISISKEVNRDKVKRLLAELKLELFPELESNESYGIFSNHIDEKAQILYDIHQSLRYVQAWSDKPEGGIQTWFSPPMKTSKENFPIVEVKE